jgi:hypothetical protein
MRSSTTTAAGPRDLGQTGAVTQAEANRLAKQFVDLLTLHRVEAEPARPPVALPPPEPDVAEVHDRHHEAATDGLRFFQRRRRAAARARADQAAGEELDATRARRAREQAEHQADLDVWWQALVGNDPDVVLSVLATALQDAAAPAAPLGVQGSEATLVVLVPPESVVPDQVPEMSGTGGLTLRELSLGERSDLYAKVVMGHGLATVRRAMAVAPGLRSARVVAMRRSRPDLYGRPRLDCVLAGRWTRHSLDRARWDTTDARTVAEDTAAELLFDFRAGRSLQPLDLMAQPDVRRLVDVVDADHLTG